MRQASLHLSLVVLFSALSAAAQTVDFQSANEPVSEPPRQVKESLGAIEAVVQGASLSRDERVNTQWALLANYAYIDSWVPSKVGLAAAFVLSAASTIEAQFDRGLVGFDFFTVSLGHIEDVRATVLFRQFGGFNSFNWHVGLHYNWIRFQLSDDYIRSVPAPEQSGARVIELATVGPTVGLGNRWQTRNGFVWSFDWLQIHIPLVTVRERHPFLTKATDPEARRDAADVIRVSKYAPTGTMLKLQLGFAF